MVPEGTPTVSCLEQPLLLPFMEGPGLLEVQGDVCDQCCICYSFQQALCRERQGFSSPWEISQRKGGSYLIRLSQLCILRSQSQTASLPCKIFTIPFSCEQSQELLSEHAPPVQIDGSCMNMEQSKIPESCCSAESFLRGKSFCWRNCLVILSIFDTCTGSVRSSTTVLRKKIKSWVPKWRKRTDKLLAFYCYCCLKFP